jgi:hypothetical protein
MPEFEIWLLACTCAGLCVGGWGILWARMGAAPLRLRCGRGLFLTSLVFLGGSSLVAAQHRADGLVPLGLSAGLLLIGMLWEAPSSAGPRPEVLSLSDER